MTIGMEDEQVGKMICSSIDPLKNVMDVPSGFFRDLLVTDRTSSLLVSPQSDELFPFKPTLMPLESHSFVEVSFPGWIVWISVAPNDPVSSNGDLSGLMGWS